MYFKARGFDFYYLSIYNSCRLRLSAPVIKLNKKVSIKKNSVLCAILYIIYTLYNMFTKFYDVQLSGLRMKSLKTNKLTIALALAKL